MSDTSLQTFDDENNKNNDKNNSPSSMANIATSALPFQFFLVTPMTAGGWTEMVAVYPNGSFACTHPYFTNHGILSKHIMAVFISGYMYRNVAMQCHLIYHKRFVKQLPMDIKLSQSVARDRE